jgi:DNA-binding NtrC family response regulator
MVHGEKKAYPSPEKGRPVNRQLRKRLILISNDAQLQSLMLLAINESRIRVEETLSVQAVLEWLSKPELDLVIFDADTPGLSVMDDLKSIRQAAVDAPVIVVTSDNSVEMGKQVMQERVFFYTVKPVNVWEMTAIVDAAWANVSNQAKKNFWA